MLPVTLKQIGSFLMVAKCLNFSAAAKALYISQPALSKTISRLENDIQLKLFVRNKGGIELTSEGKYLYDELFPHYNKISNALQYAQYMHDSRTKILRFGCTTPYEQYNFIDNAKRVLQEYERTHPNVVVISKILDYKDIREALIFKDVDLVITSTVALEDADNISMKKTEWLDACIAVSSEHRLASFDTLQVHELNNEVLFAVESYDSTVENRRLLNQCRLIGFEPRSIQFLPNFPSVMMAVRQRRGFTLLGNYRSFSVRAEFCYFPVPILNDTYYTSIMWRTNDISKQAQEFIDLIPDI